MGKISSTYTLTIKFPKKYRVRQPLGGYETSRGSSKNLVLMLDFLRHFFLLKIELENLDYIRPISA